MCFGGGSQKQETPAPAPAPALQPPDVPTVGDGRKKETMDAYGADAPNYRVKRKATGSSVNPDSDIVM